MVVVGEAKVVEVDVEVVVDVDVVVRSVMVVEAKVVEVDVDVLVVEVVGKGSSSYTPSPVAAYRVIGGIGPIARRAAFPGGRPVFAAAQLSPPSVLSNTPNDVPTYNVVGVLGSISRAPTVTRSGRPVLARVQFSPPVVLLNTPFAPAPA